MKVLVTGGLGYVGGRIARYLAEHADIELLISTRRPERARPGWLCNGELVSTVNDLQRNGDKWRGVDAVIHLATLNETVSNRDTARALKVNCLGTLRLLDAATAAGVRHFIYFSTVHVYGTPLKGTLSETALPRPIQPYAIAHRAAEDFVLAAGACGGIQATIVRLANAIGAPIDTGVQRWTLLTNDLCREAIIHRRMELRSSGRQWRNFIGLTDVARAAEHLLRLPKCPGDDCIYNLASERSRRVIEIAQLIADRCDRMYDYRPEIVLPPLPHPEDEAELDIVVDRLKKTGFSFRDDLVEEIDSTLRFCAAHS